MWWRYASTASLVSLDRKSTRLNSSHTEIYTLSLHDALPIFIAKGRYVVVNIPGEQIEAVENNVVALRLNGVVGKPERPSPMLSSNIEEVKFNPVWTLPPTVVKEDLL